MRLGLLGPEDRWTRTSGPPACRPYSSRFIDGYGPSNQQRSLLAEATEYQMVSRAADLDDMARTDPTFARLLDLDYARAARGDAE